jgi:phosphatidylglycerophosphate synthase
VGKAGTFVLMTAFPCWLLGSIGGAWHPATDVAFALSVVGIVLAWAALVSYIGPARSALSARRVGGKA